MRRHLRWVIPLVAGVVVVVALPALASVVTSSPGFDTSLGLSFLSLGLVLATPVAVVVTIVMSVRGGMRTFRDWRHRGGHYTKSERGAELARVNRLSASEAAWAEARRLRQALLAHQVPQSITVWEVVPQAGEVFFYSVEAEYERFYGQTVSYGGGGRFFFGHPAFVLAGLAVSTLSNASARRAAEAQARDQWREHQHIRLVVSNQRLICLAGGQWLSFPYSAMTAVYPEVGDWALVMEFDGITSPLRLRGVDAPLAAVMTLFGTHGLDAVAQHPSLQLLDRDIAGGGADVGGAPGTEVTPRA
ncbi:hypothetical protein [Frigoribacterium faeni]|uniref:Uncharacterized protein n=1 Tax=Frigoribacterium faeni TaxID=145483 RepID=A0A7W3JJZ4_9MICO|nr:hypothetical protein [Frigoribacterium faeni]MBA8814281.1 hypothetical protein [Frigoribacterium faeni]GEK83221.1 hypothetical protein FFA01_15300 [Frigoribacterium faeni]